jgi:hypothetical protein
VPAKDDVQEMMWQQEMKKRCAAEEKEVELTSDL